MYHNIKITNLNFYLKINSNIFTRHIGVFHGPPPLIWVIAVVTGICHAKQAAMADYYRQFHLYFLKGEDGSELETASDLKAKLKNLSWSHDLRKKLTLTVYTNYTVQQEATAPAMQALRRELKQRFPSGRIPSRSAMPSVPPRCR